MSGFFVTGTDTGVGKTLVACALLHACAARGLRAVGMKPVAAGAHTQRGRLVNDDASALKAASNVTAPDDLINPYCFEQPIAPHVAAAKAGVAIDLERLKQAYTELAAISDCVVIEGAGGFRVPLGPVVDTAHLAALLAQPIVLVVGVRLGCINHALLTATAIDSVGVPFAGWVANHIDPDMLHAGDTVECLSERLTAPLLGRIGYAHDADASRAASLIDMDSLLAHVQRSSRR